MLSGPGALLGFNDASASKTSISDIHMSDNWLHYKNALNVH